MQARGDDNIDIDTQLLGMTGSYTIDGRAGDDEIDLFGTNDQYSGVELIGGPGEDLLLGNDGSETVYGDRKNEGASDYRTTPQFDIISTFAGDDTIYGGYEQVAVYEKSPGEQASMPSPFYQLSGLPWTNYDKNGQPRVGGDGSALFDLTGGDYIFRTSHGDQINAGPGVNTIYGDGTGCTGAVTLLCPHNDNVVVSSADKGGWDQIFAGRKNKRGEDVEDWHEDETLTPAAGSEEESTLTLTMATFPLGNVVDGTIIVKAPAAKQGAYRVVFRTAKVLTVADPTAKLSDNGDLITDWVLSRKKKYFGGPGNDMIDAGQGLVEIDAGAGDDRITWEIAGLRGGSLDKPLVNGNTGTDTLDVTFTDDENLVKVFENTGRFGQ